MSHNQVIRSVDKETVPGPAEPIRVLVAETTRMASELVAEALQRDEEGFRVYSTLSTSPDLSRALLEICPSVVLLGAGSPEEIHDVISRVQSQLPSARVVIMVDQSKREIVVEAFRSGANGIFCRAASVPELRKCVYTVHRGEVWAGHNELKFLLEALANTAAAKLAPKGLQLLTSREQEIARCVAEGMLNREIAVRLGLSEHTVKNYLFRIFDKLGVSNRAELVFLAFSRMGAAFLEPRLDPLDMPVEASAAFQWSQRAATRFSLAQMMLGEMYSEGRGTDKDLKTAYMWYVVAEVTSQARTARCRAAMTRLASKLSAAEVADAERRAREWLKEKEHSRSD